MAVTLIKLILSQNESREKLKTFFQNLKRKTVPNLEVLLPENFPRNLRLILQKMLTVNPQTRPCSEILFEIVSSENFLKMNIEMEILKLKKKISMRVSEECHESETIEKEDTSMLAVETELTSNQLYKKVVFDFDFFSTKTKKGSESNPNPNNNMTLNSILDFPSPFDLNNQFFDKGKSLSAAMSPERHFELPSISTNTTKVKKQVFFDFDGNTQESLNLSHFDGFDLSKSKIQSKPGYLNFDYDFSNFSSNIWIES